MNGIYLVVHPRNRRWVVTPVIARMSGVLPVTEEE